MANFNRVLLMGNLTRDPELRYIPNGSAVTNLRLAVNRSYKNQAGELKEEVTYVNIVVWGKQAENCAEYLAKGSSIFVEGRLQSRQWETDDGQKRSTLEVVADRVQFLERKRSAAAGGEARGETRAERPSGTEQEQVPGAASEAAPEDDIPF
jgi:single-strand DNA-binding protein